MSTTTVHFVERANTVRFTEQPTTVHFVDRSTTVQFVDRSTTVHFVERSTTVLFPTSTVTQAMLLAMLQSYYATLEFFNSNDDAKAGTNADGDPVTPLVAGDEYKAGPGHENSAYGARIFVI